MRERGITLVGVALGGLESDAFVQPELLLDGVDRGGIDAAVDAVAVRFGTQAVVRASLLRRGAGLEVPLLEDGPPTP